jgi:glyoxylase-like metal-dependent hydrolase (beta-lactamase superfamily II)
MPHGTRRVGDVEIVALCDGVTHGSGPVTDSFPGADDAVWDEVRTRFPDTIDDAGRWRLHVHCYLLRTAARTILVDTGVGPETAPAYGWSGIRGALLEELAAAGVDPAEVDDVVISHVHDDHLGWTVLEDAPEPAFPNARYRVHAADLELLRTSHDPEDREIFTTSVDPLERAGVLEANGDAVELAVGITVVHAPGHTPGHQVVLIDSGGERWLVSADLFNHPVVLVKPGVNGDTDMDPDTALATRLALLERLDREGRGVSTSHLPEPFGTVARDGERWSWTPEVVEAPTEGLG